MDINNGSGKELRRIIIFIRRRTSSLSENIDELNYTMFSVYPWRPSLTRTREEEDEQQLGREMKSFKKTDCARDPSLDLIGMPGVSNCN